MHLKFRSTTAGTAGTAKADNFRLVIRSTPWAKGKAYISFCFSAVFAVLAVVD